MQKTPLNSAKAVMVIAMDIFGSDSPNGVPVCGKGTELARALIARFANMNIATLYVAGHPVWEEGGYLNAGSCLTNQANRLPSTTMLPNL